MKTTKCAISTWLLLFFLIIYAVSVHCNDNIASDWKISGQNSIHFDYYNSSGPNGAYLQEGWQSYNDFNLQFQNTANPYNTMKGYFSGTINESPYRAANYGLLIERFNFNQENGNNFVPYRLDVGDFYAFQTPRILQRSLKGGQIELQPGTMLGANQSILFQLGGIAQDYLDNKKWDNMFGGASWMMNWEDTRLAFNYTANRQAAQTEIPSLKQYVWGMALNHNFSLLRQKLIFDAEWDFLRGDSYANGSVNHNKGQGRFIQLQGRSQIPITYSSRYEEYDSEYLPNGSVVNGGRRVFDNRAGWQLAAGYSINGRAQFYRDGMGTTTVTDTDVFGIGMSGIIPNPLLRGVNGNIDAYRQHANSDSSETVIDSLNMNFSAPLSDGWSTRISASLQDQTVQKGVAANNTTQQYGFDIGRSVEIVGFKGTANLGLTYYIDTIQGLL